VRIAAPLARLAVEPISGSPEITGRWGRPTHLAALCCGSRHQPCGRVAQLRAALACLDVTRAVSEHLAQGP